MSGGVDSSVTAALLVAAGYDVTGVFMKNWAQDLPGFKCPWREDLADAKRVAVQLGIPFKIYDFQAEYKQKVVDYMIEGYKAGITPNPDIMCNQEVKFKLFLDTALEDGADMIATGHYARISGSTSSNKQIAYNNSRHPERVSGSGKDDVEISDRVRNDKPQLVQAVDSNKDQTYFLYRVTEEALQKTLFPLGEMTKPEVREKAKELGLVTADKKDSVGICFVGEIGIKEFLQNFVETEPGDIVDIDTNNVVGRHDGALYYTIGQRHGLSVGGGMPYYVVGKDMDKNEVYVTTDLNNATLWQKEFTITNPHWIGGKFQISNPKSQIQVRTRHRAPLINCTIEPVGENFTVKLKDEIRALTPGQSAVFYTGDVCIGGGIIT